MGSTEGPLFREEFRVEVDYAIVTLNLEQQVRLCVLLVRPVAYFI